MFSKLFLHDSEIEKVFNQSCRLYLITEKKHTFNYRLMRKQTLVIAATTPCIIPSQFLVWKCIFVLNKGNGWSTYLLQTNIANKLKLTLRNIFSCYNESNSNLQNLYNEIFWIYDVQILRLSEIHIIIASLRFTKLLLSMFYINARLAWSVIPPRIFK